MVYFAVQVHTTCRVCQQRQGHARGLHRVCGPQTMHDRQQGLPAEAGHLDICQQSGHGRGHIHAGQNLQPPCTWTQHDHKLGGWGSSEELVEQAMVEPLPMLGTMPMLYTINFSNPSYPVSPLQPHIFTPCHQQVLQPPCLQLHMQPLWFMAPKVCESRCWTLHQASVCITDGTEDWCTSHGAWLQTHPAKSGTR